MPLTTAQQQTLVAALRAETNAGVVAALAARNDGALLDWCNSNSNQDAWNSSVSRSDLFEAIDITKFDNITAGKRDAWGLMMQNAPLDMSRNKLRKGVEDVWGADAVTVLPAFVRKATQAEKYLGGNSATSSTVTAVKLNWSGSVGQTELSVALNTY